MPKTAKDACPTRVELLAILESLDEKRLRQLLMAGYAHNTSSLEDKPLPIAAVMCFAVHDWMTTLNVLPEQDRQIAVLACKRQLAVMADLWAREEWEDEEPGHAPVALAVLDGRFIGLRTPIDAGAPEALYDLKTGKWLSRLPHHILTAVSCDLSVLLLRLFDRMKKIRGLQEHKDGAAADNDTTPRSEGGGAGGPDGPGDVRNDADRAAD